MLEHSHRLPLLFALLLATGCGAAQHDGAVGGGLGGAELGRLFDKLLAREANKDGSVGRMVELFDGAQACVDFTGVRGKTMVATSTGQLSVSAIKERCEAIRRGDVRGSATGCGYRIASISQEGMPGNKWTKAAIRIIEPAQKADRPAGQDVWFPVKCEKALASSNPEFDTFIPELHDVCGTDATVFAMPPDWQVRKNADLSTYRVVNVVCFIAKPQVRSDWNIIETGRLGRMSDTSK